MRTPAEEATAGPALLRADGVALLLDVAGPALPRVLHFGADPGALDARAAARLVRDLTPAVAHNAPDEPWSLPLLPGEADGWSGRPGLAGHRDGRDAFARLAVEALELDGEQALVVTAADHQAGVSTRSELRLEPCGVLRVRHEVTNTGTGSYTLTGLNAVLPVPAQAAELLDLTGRWCRERSPQRRPFQHGTHARESRRGRTGHDATLLLLAGTPGFGFRNGEVWGVHVAWSGNHVHLAERLPEGAGAGGTGVLGGGELLLPGEVRLEHGQSYATPWVVFVWSAAGLDGVSARLHRWLRQRPGHPRSPRPLVLNTWEAVYFDHDAERLSALAERAASIGVERFVLDDGWFLGRRDDTRGLGDWFVDAEVWPHGLRPLATRVRAMGMQFGLWVEPEMANPDSRLAREHPDWLLAGPGRLPLLSRHQVVLDVAHPGAFGYLLERLDSLVSQIGVDFLKWDHNRDLHESVHAGAAGVHVQTEAVYALLDELRRRHPGLEIESCSSGGARVDLGILQRTDRIWASDTNDSLERQAIQRWTGLLVPPELVGCHVGPPVSHTTGRTFELTFRCITALFGHAGLEWDLTSCSPQELAQLSGWAGLYRELRGLLHTGVTVRADHPDPGAWVHGVVSADGREALFCHLRLATSPDVVPNRLRLPGLQPDAEYQLTVRDEAGTASGPQRVPPPWWRAGQAVATGAVLERVGLPAPLLNPGQAVLLHLIAR
jgi:alpha-galactosidase